MNKCSVVLLSMTENDITKEVERMKRQFKIDEVKKNVKKLDPFEMLEFTRHAFIVESQLEETNGHINFESLSDDALQLMHQYFNKPNALNIMTVFSGFVVCLPGCGKFVVSTPMWKHCALNPLQHPMFTLGESWEFDLQNDGSLVIALPAIDGKRESFVFSELIWRSWLENNEVNHAQSVEPHSNTSLSLLSTTEIAKLLGEDDILAALLSMDWTFDGINISIGGKTIDSIREETQPNIVEQSAISTHDNDEEEKGYDASIEVGLNQ